MFSGLGVGEKQNSTYFQKEIVERKEKPLNLIGRNLLHRTLSNQLHSLSHHLESFLILLMLHFHHLPRVLTAKDLPNTRQASLLFHMLIYLLIYTLFFQIWLHFFHRQEET